MIDLHKAFAPPTWQSPFGYTPLGQSVHGEILGGAAETLTLAISALVIVLALSLCFAAIAYLLPRFLQRLLAALIDAWLAIPGIFIALSVGFFLPQGYASVLLALVLSEFASLQKYFLQRLGDAADHDFVLSARLIGANSRHLLSWHILPALLREAGYLFFITLPSIVLSLAGLEFLGVQSGSERLSLGMQVALYKDYILLYPHLSLAPVLCLILLLFILSNLAKRVQKS